MILLALLALNAAVQVGAIVVSRRVLSALRAADARQDEAIAGHEAKLAMHLTWFQHQVTVNDRLIDAHNHLHRELIAIVTTLPMRSQLPPH